MKQEITIETLDQLKEAIKTVWGKLSNETYIDIIQTALGCYVMNKPELLEDALNDLDSYKKWVDMPLVDRPFFLNSSL